MKTMLASVFAALCFAASAAVVELVPGYAATVPGGKLAHVEAISTVAAGTVSVTSEALYYTNALEVVELPPVTNVTTEAVDFTYIGTNYVSYATNVVVTTGYATNEVTRLAIAATNTIDTLTCSSGVGAKSPSDKWIAPGAKVWFTGTANDRVWLYIDEN